MNTFAWTLPLAAATVGALHTLAPDHWMPFAALARARGWTPVRAVRTTVICGLGHVTVSAILGIAVVVVRRPVDPLGTPTVHKVDDAVAWIREQS